jgi:protein-tyrosine phosphatase
MPRIVDFRAADDPRDVVHQIVQTLAEGELAGLPTETGYVVAAHALQQGAAERLARVRQRLGCPQSVLALKNPQEALDYVPQMGLLGRKLIRRFWPGPVTLLFDESSGPGPGLPAQGLGAALPPAAHGEVWREGRVALRVPAHELTGNVLRLLPAPLVVTGEISGPGSQFSTAADVGRAVPDDISVVVDAGPCRYDLPTTLVRVGRERWDVVHEGVVSARTLNRLAGTMYLFVCTGNTCRSPMAEGLFRKLLAERLHCAEDELVDRGYVVVSAGVAAGPGSPASPEAIDILRDRGVDLRGHESQPVTPQLLSQADQIFTMTRSHRELLVREFPEAAPRVRLLARDGSDVIDPMGAGLEEYRTCAEQIERYLRNIVAELPAIASENHS